MKNPQKLHFDKGTRKDARIAIGVCVAYQKRVTIYVGNNFTGAMISNLFYTGYFVPDNNGAIRFKCATRRERRIITIDTSKIVLITETFSRLKRVVDIYKHPTLYTLGANTSVARIVIPEGWPTVSDPHHSSTIVWTYYEGEFYHKTNTQTKWVKSKKSHITPYRVMMFYELLTKTGNIVGDCHGL